jgi:hypothetical protein
MSPRKARAPLSPADEAWRSAPEGAHEWMSFPDPDEERTWLFDVTFLESRWTCIFGRGCQGVMTGPAPELVQGCCSYGAHFTGAKDARRVEAVAATLRPDQWQFHRQGQARDGGKPRVVKKGRNGVISTRLVKEACIFLNRPDFPGGAGCALHRAALERGVPPLELKPDVCWQLPLRREDEVADDGSVTSTIRQWDRRDWGAGGFEFHWWCTEAPDAFVGSRPVYEELALELTALTSKKIYRRLVRYLRARAGLDDGANQSGSGTGKPTPVPVPLPHPAVRRR